MIENIKGFFTENLKELATVLGVFGVAIGFYGGLGLVAKYERERDPAILRCFVSNPIKYHSMAAVRGFDDNDDGKIDRITILFNEDGTRTIGRSFKEYTSRDIDFVNLENTLIKRGHLKGTRPNRIVGYFAKGEGEN